MRQNFHTNTLLFFFSASFAEATEKTCLVKGKTYQIGDKIQAEPGACLAACVCQNPLKGKR
jgi:hypothetical protein